MVTVDRLPTAVVVHVEGEVDLSNVKEVESRLFDALASDGRGVVLDLSRTRYLDSSGVSLLFTVAQRSEDQGTTLRVVVTDEAMIRRVLVLTHLGSRVPIDDDVDVALEALTTSTA
jgi:anti-anti-sigma factor